VLVQNAVAQRPDVAASRREGDNFGGVVGW